VTQEASREVESGTHDELQDRPALLKAIAHAKPAKSIMVIAKLDRLVRSTIAMRRFGRAAPSSWHATTRPRMS
jgi:DNA invertase Pin-like site-specific DNA recombinase